jgi:signal transducer and activator of transcription 5B
MFKASVGRGIENENLRFLAGKAFKNSNLQDLNNAFLSWSQFNKELMPKRNFTFWEWFYAIFKLTREHLNGIWNEGLILGFVCRQRTEELLLETCSGTFLLRFSDSELGGITIAYNADVRVEHIHPFTSRGLRIRCLADRIRDIKQLNFLYPKIPKDEAFYKYYTQFNENEPQYANGYIKPALVNTWIFENNNAKIDLKFYNSHPL